MANIETDADGTWEVTEDARDGVVVVSRVLVEPSPEKLARDAAAAAAVAADVAAAAAAAAAKEQSTPTPAEVEEALALLDARTATVEQMQGWIAQIVRYLRTHR